MAAGDSIPVVDIEGVSTCSDLSTCPQVGEIHSAFTKVGFVFIKNHGINKKLIENVFSSAMDFFNQPSSVKNQYRQHVGKDDTQNSGYNEIEQESVDPSKPGDLKESFQVAAIEHDFFPDKEVPGFKPVLLNLYQSTIALACTLMQLMGHALHLKDPKFFVKAHSKSGHLGNFTTCRVLHYPPLPPSFVPKPGQLRCGEHVDYGTISLLFQDPTGGLQVKKSGGGYIDVPYMPDMVLVNLGILMQKWTADTYLATPHRVLLPEEESDGRNRGRQSMVVFVHPDHDTVIECLDGSNKYPAITAYQDTQQLLQDTYK